MSGGNARISTGYLISQLIRRLEARNVIPGGKVTGASLRMMASGGNIPLEVFICPLHQPLSSKFGLGGKYFNCINGSFNVYYRHRNALDIDSQAKRWLLASGGYYEIMAACYAALNEYWPIGDIDPPDAFNGMNLTTAPIKCRMFNEPRKSYKDDTMGEGMMEIQASYLIDQPITAPSAET